MARKHTFAVLVACLFAWMASCLGQDTSTNDIYARLRALEDKDRDQATLLEQYKSDLQALTSVVNRYTSRLQHQDTLIRGFVKRVSKLERQVTSLRNVNAVLRQTDDDKHDSQTVITDGIKNTNELKARSTENGRIRRSNVDFGPVMFHAVFNVHNVYTVSDTIVFPHIVSNLGGDYNSNTGIFTATQPGIYLFSLTVESIIDETLRVVILKNGIELAGVWADGRPSSYDQGSVTVATKLVPGDEVWTKRASGDSTIYGDGETTFMGLLVIPL